MKPLSHHLDHPADPVAGMRHRVPVLGRTVPRFAQQTVASLCSTTAIFVGPLRGHGTTDDDTRHR
jgi:hypothetical protein